MPLVYITGPTGSGKSTVGLALRDKGYLTYDTDSTGMRSMQRVNGKDVLTADREVLQELCNHAGTDKVFVCGTSPTDLDCQDLFSQIFVLVLDETEQRNRILNRTNNQYGKQPHQLENAAHWRQPQIDKYLRAGAIAIDATLPVETIGERILTYT